MADRAGSLVGIRSGAGPLQIKVTRSNLDPELKNNRSVTTDASQWPRTIITQNGGLLKGTGYIDPANAANAALLAGVGAIGVNQDMSTVKYIIDVSETAGSRKGFDMGTCRLVITDIGQQTDEGGMQEINFEVHTQGGMTYATNLT